MVLEQKPRASKRLERLVKSGFRPAGDVARYASELKQLVPEITDKKQRRHKPDCSKR